MNYLEASISLHKLFNLVTQQAELIEMCGKSEQINKSIRQIRRVLRDQITQNIIEFLFMKRANSMLFEQRLVPLHKLVCSHMHQEQVKVKEIRQETACKQVQGMLTSIARLNANSTYDTKKLLESHAEQPSQVVQQALTSLQKNHNESITQFNTAYLVLLLDCYRRVTTEIDLKDDEEMENIDPVQIPFSKYLEQVIDEEMRALFVRLVNSCAKL
jgi:hypothetical protein